jgi:hypothetical protein
MLSNNTLVIGLGIGLVGVGIVYIGNKYYRKEESVLELNKLPESRTISQGIQEQEKNKTLFCKKL